eukprot:TRINITY_DN9287_c0_g1_i2.p1 TRINITY_DN9287_c0_g1~~TRINITY_DN9287_c0_g1_i2.p1  ORF type:complete len:133 (-),score=9.53 TRINITY_DN9287_c0_g1_i2:108-506(-)
MPSINKKVWNNLLKLFRVLIKNTEQTKMNEESIAISIGPTLMLSQKIRVDPHRFLTETQKCQESLVFIIRHGEFIFDINLDDPVCRIVDIVDQSNSVLSRVNSANFSRASSIDLRKPIRATSVQSKKLLAKK